MAMSSILVKSFQLSTLATALALTGCGGGNNMILPNTGSSSSTAVAKVNITPIEMIDTNGKSTRVVNTAGVTAKVQVTDAKGKPITGALVTFSGEGVAFGTSNGSVVTNSEGVASISVKPTDVNDTGSYQLTATTTVDGVTATTAPFSFSLQAIDIELSALAADNTSTLKGGDKTIISLTTLNSLTKSPQGNVAVNFSASCGTFDNQVVTSNELGKVQTTYSAIDSAGNLCQGNQTITAASANNNTINQKITLNVAAIVGNSISYTTTENVYLPKSDSGSATSKTITFKVTSNGVAAPGQQVKIDVTNAPADLSVGTYGNRQSYTAVTDNNGNVSINLYAGQIPGPVEIKASLVSNPASFALARNIFVATGRVSQFGLSLSAGKYSLNSQLDGDNTTITARMVDRFGNPVPAGTRVSFVAEGGRVDPSCVTKGTADDEDNPDAGSCNVNFYVQNPRPADNRVTILAYVEGEKAFTDVNGNNSYDLGLDSLVNNIGDFFRDDNEDNQYQTGEYIYKRGASGATCGTSSFLIPNLMNTCDNNLDATVRGQMVFAFANNRPVFVGVSGTNTAFTSISSTYFTFQIYGNSEKTVPMPSGTTVDVSAQDNTTTPSTGTGTTTPDTTCKAELLSGHITVPDSLNLLTPTEFAKTSNQSVMYGVRLTGCSAGDDVRITVKTPSDETVTRNITL